MFLDVAPCTGCLLLAQGMERDDGHADLERIAVWTGYHDTAIASRNRCRSCGIVWLHDESAGWRIYDPDGLLDGVMPERERPKPRVVRNT